MLSLVKLLMALPGLANLAKWFAEEYRKYDAQAKLADADRRASEKRSDFDAAMRAARLPSPEAPVQHSPVGPESSGISSGGQSSP